MVVVVDGEYLNWWKCLGDADDISVTFVQVNLGNDCIHLSVELLAIPLVYDDDRVRGQRCDKGKDYVRVNGVLLAPKPLVQPRWLPNEDSRPFR